MASPFAGFGLAYSQQPNPFAAAIDEVRRRNQAAFDWQQQQTASMGYDPTAIQSVPGWRGALGKPGPLPTNVAQAMTAQRESQTKLRDIGLASKGIGLDEQKRAIAVMQDIEDMRKAGKLNEEQYITLMAKIKTGNFSQGELESIFRPEEAKAGRERQVRLEEAQIETQKRQGEYYGEKFELTKLDRKFIAGNLNKNEGELRVKQITEKYAGITPGGGKKRDQFVIFVDSLKRKARGESTDNVNDWLTLETQEEVLEWIDDGMSVQEIKAGLQRKYKLYDVDLVPIIEQWIVQNMQGGKGTVTASELRSANQITSNLGKSIGTAPPLR